MIGSLNKWLGKKTEQEIKELAINEIDQNPYQPRKSFNEEQLEELAESIKKVGVIQPVVVRRVGQRYELVAGERRLRACRLAGLDRVTAVIKDFCPQEMAEIALIENIQRQDLNFFEEAEAYATLLGEFQLTQEQLAQRLGRSQGTIANKLRLLRLPPVVRQFIQQYNISERHARALLVVEDVQNQLAWVERIAKENLSVKEMEQLITAGEFNEKINISREIVKKTRKKPKIKGVIKDLRIFVNTVKQAAKTLQDGGVQVKITEREHEKILEILIQVEK